MPQNPILVTIVQYPAPKPALNISAPDTVKTEDGTLISVSVTTAGGSPGTANDCAATGDAAAGNLIWDIPNAVGFYELNWPCQVGITIVPGAGQVVSVSYK